MPALSLEGSDITGSPTKNSSNSLFLLSAGGATDVSPVRLP
jgi:hypothetical protein